MESKLKTARALLTQDKPENKEELKKYNENRTRGLKIFEGLCKSDLLQPEEKLLVIEEFCSVSLDNGEDIINRWRDSIPHLKGDLKDNLMRLLTLICLSPRITSYLRIIIAITFYNHGDLTRCYDCFSTLAKDPSLMIEHRIEAAKYLFISNNEDNIELSKSVIMNVIQMHSFPSDYRYAIIASYISPKTVMRIKSIFNAEKLNSYYDEDFVRDLQLCFFNDDNNGTRERILSGQHILQMESVNQEIKDGVVSSLFGIASDCSLDDNTRADAADVIHRLGTKLQVSRARDIITNLGKSTVGTNLKDQIIYNNSQNVHSISKYADEFIERVIRDFEGTKIKLRSFSDVHREVGDHIRKVLHDIEDRNKAYESLNRINIDTATFTRSKITIAEIFVHVWMKIQSYEPDIREEIKRRMVDELVEMSGTCSSGHSARLVNVLSVYDSTLRISWGDQLKANINGRMNASIRDSGDEMREQIAVGMFEDADEEDKIIAREFINNRLEDLRTELYNEFVKEGYIGDEEFNKNFDKFSDQWKV